MCFFVSKFLLYLVMLSAEKLKKKYGPLGGKIIRANIQRDAGNLGLALAGCRDRTKMGSYVAGINPKGSASIHNLQIGDEILEVTAFVRLIRIRSDID